MKAIKKLFILLMVLIFIGILSGYAVVYYSINDRHEKYIEYISKYSKEYGIEESLIAAVIKVESNFYPNAVSHADAIGLMQLIPETGKHIASKLGEEFKVENLKDPETNIKYGTFYLRYLIGYYKNLDYAIIAYNGGLGNVNKWIDSGILNPDSDDYSKIPFNETRDYIRKVKSEYYLFNDIYEKYMKDTETSRSKKSFKMYLDFIKKIFVN